MQHRPRGGGDTRVARLWTGESDSNKDKTRQPRLPRCHRQSIETGSKRRPKECTQSEPANATVIEALRGSREQMAAKCQSQQRTELLHKSKQSNGRVLSGGINARDCSTKTGTNSCPQLTTPIPDYTPTPGRAPTSNKPAAPHLAARVHTAEPRTSSTGIVAKINHSFRDGT